MKQIMYMLFALLSLGAAPLKIVGPTQVDAYKLVELTPDGDTTGAALIWDVDREDVADIREYGNRLVFTGPSGTYKVKLRVVKFDGKSVIAETTRLTVVIGSPTPIPPPVPPIPPDPPGPTPGPVPIPDIGFRAMIVYESADATKMTKGQLSAMYSNSVRQYLRDKTVKGPDGKTGEWRMWDKDVDATGESKLWQDVMKRPRQSLPWIIISNGKAGFEGPLPDGIQPTLDLLKKYGG